MGNSPYSSLILIALMVVAFYFLILRPQKKRQRAQQATMNSLVPGTRVLLGSGFFGTLVAIGEKQAVVELSPGVEITILKQAIARTAAESDEEPAWQTHDDVADDAATGGSLNEAGSRHDAESLNDAFNEPSFDDSARRDVDFRRPVSDSGDEAQVIEPQGVDANSLEVQSQAGDPSFDAPRDPVAPSAQGDRGDETDPSSGTTSSTKE